MVSIRRLVTSQCEFTYHSVPVKTHTSNDDPVSHMGLAIRGMDKWCSCTGSICLNAQSLATTGMGNELDP